MNGELISNSFEKIINLVINMINLTIKNIKNLIMKINVIEDNKNIVNNLEKFIHINNYTIKIFSLLINNIHAKNKIDNMHQYLLFIKNYIDSTCGNINRIVINLKFGLLNYYLYDFTKYGINMAFMIMNLFNIVKNIICFVIQIIINRKIKIIYV
jgi:hypothetical protein